LKIGGEEEKLKKALVRQVNKIYKEGNKMSSFGLGLQFRSAFNAMTHPARAISTYKAIRKLEYRDTGRLEFSRIQALKITVLRGGYVGKDPDTSYIYGKTSGSNPFTYIPYFTYRPILPYAGKDDPSVSLRKKASESYPGSNFIQSLPPDFFMKLRNKADYEKPSGISAHVKPRTGAYAGKDDPTLKKNLPMLY